MTQTNIDYWEKIIKDPSNIYKNLFEQENEYLRKSIKKGSKVLDVACGDGRNILSIVNIAGTITGIDIEQKAVDDAKKRLEDYSNVEIMLGDAFDLPFDDKTYDTAILSMTLVNFNNEKQKALSEMKRVIKEDCQIIISVYSEDSLDKRLDMYRKIEIPIEEVQKNKVVFSESIGAYISEQFSISEIKEMIKPIGLIIENYEEVEGLVYIITLRNQG